MIIIRPETSEDYTAIFEVNKLAFEQENEAQLVEKIRHLANFNPQLSLVAVKSSKVIGHILFSNIIIQSQKGSFSALALAPLAVHPEFQNQGIGSQLVQQGLRKCQSLGHKIVVVIGHPTFYTRFGFSSATAKGLSVLWQVPDEAFMILELIPDALDGISGVVKYPSVFDAV